MLGAGLAADTESEMADCSPVVVEGSTLLLCMLFIPMSLIMML